MQIDDPKIHSSDLAESLNTQYWTLQFAGWGAMALLSYLSLTIWYNPGQVAPVVHTLVQSLLGILISHPLRWVAKACWHSKLSNRMFLNGGAVLLASAVWTVFRIATFTWLTGEEIPIQDWGGWSFASVIVFGAWSFCYHAIRYYQQSLEQGRITAEAQNIALKARSEAQAESVKRLEAENLFREAQLRMLRYQLNPHFFLNALNSVSSLVMTEDRNGAMDMLSKIGDFLRVSLDDVDLVEHTLEEEIDALQLYLSIELVRFGDRLETRFDIDDEVRAISIPNLLLQPLFENAIKYAVSERLESTVVSLVAERVGRDLVLSVSDNGPGRKSVRKQKEGPGIGLSNVRQRLESVYPDRFEMTLNAKQPTGFEVVIKIHDVVEQ